MSISEQTKLIEEGVFIDVQGEVHHNGPLSVRQDYAKYTDEEHRIWAKLFKQQWDNLQDIAYTVWLKAIQSIGLVEDRIPKLSEVGELIYDRTRWRPVPISGFLSAKDYFGYLARRQFPTVTNIRTADEFDFMVEPDLFHDAFGHLPMHTHPVFADFLQLFGKTALMTETEEQMTEMQRLYWFTVEYGLIHEDGKLKVCGSGHLSGIKESRFSLTDGCKKIPFSLKTVCNTDFNPHVLQETLFVFESYEEVYEAMAAKAKEFGIELE